MAAEGTAFLLDLNCAIEVALDCAIQPLRYACLCRRFAAAT
jgi:hypothetical protein